MEERGILIMIQISSGVIAKAQKVVIYGPEGVGKSTFASQFPDPIFTDTEGSPISTGLFLFRRFKISMTRLIS